MALRSNGIELKGATSLTDRVANAAMRLSGPARIGSAVRLYYVTPGGRSSRLNARDGRTETETAVR